MGVRGLSRFIDEQHPELYRTYKLHDCTVVVDGANLVHYLYTHSKADFMFGGNYDEFSEAIRQYFLSLIECNVDPIVVFDGGYNTSERMFFNLLERQENRLEKVKNLIRDWEEKEVILPVNSFSVFTEVLSELDITLVQCDYEGDNQMVALANDYHCPLLSNDSDFYIYELQYGFVRLSYVDTHVQRGKTKRGKSFKYINCNIYYVETFVEYFCLRNRTILPLYAVLLGNDYSRYEDFKDLFYKINVYRKDRFTGLLSWLNKYNLKQAKKQVLYLTDEEKREEIQNLIESSIDDYQIKPSNLTAILETSHLQPSDEVIQKTRIFTLCGTKLPPSFVIAIHDGLPPALLNIITLHLKILSPNVEDHSSVSCYACSRYIRQVMYGILLQHSVVSPRIHAKQCLKTVDEYDRVDGKIQLLTVRFLTKLRSGRFVPTLDDIYCMKKAYLRSFVGDLLGVPKQFFGDLPNSLQLLFGCISYWLHNCTPKPTKEFLYALLLCMIYYQVREICIQGYKNSADLFQNITIREAQIVFQNLSPYLQKPILGNRNPFKLHVVYSYNQLQVCVSDVGHINLLANLPFETPKLSKVFSGTLLYNLTKEIRSFQNPDSVVKKLLGKQFGVIDLFHFLKSKALWNIPLNYFAPTPARRESRF